MAEEEKRKRLPNLQEIQKTFREIKKQLVRAVDAVEKATGKEKEEIGEGLLILGIGIAIGVAIGLASKKGKE